MKLHNMDEQEWRRSSFKRGDSWRSDIAYQCKICHTKTNNWVMGGWPSMGPKILCPGDLYQEHDELESSLGQYQSLDKQIQDFEKTLRESPQVDGEKAQNMMDNLYSQKELLEVKVDKLRKVFSGRLDDIEGLNSDSGVKNFYPSSRCASEKKLLERTTE